MPSGKLTIKTGYELILRESDGRLCGLCWVTSADGSRLLGATVVAP